MQSLIDRDPLGSGQPDRAQIGGVEPGRIQPDLAVGGGARACRHMLGDPTQRPGQHVGAGIEDRRIAPDGQLRAARDGRLRLVVAVHIPLRCVDLARSLVDLARQGARQLGGASGDD
ncbi:hypothetical protein D3C77_615600 [compost metagenome]